jgi:hypothetical protein
MRLRKVRVQRPCEVPGVLAEKMFGEVSEGSGADTFEVQERSGADAL